MRHASRTPLPPFRLPARRDGGTLAALALGLAIVFGATACSKKQPAGQAVTPVLETMPAAKVRDRLLASASLPSVLAANDRASKLALALGMPADPQALQKLLLSQKDLPPALVAGLDLGKPIGAAVISHGKGQSPGVAVAVSAQSEAAAKAALAGAGNPAMRRMDAIMIKNAAGEPLWLWQKGDAVVGANTIDDLVLGAELALESRTAGPDDVVVRVFPDALARQEGTDVQSALRKGLDGIREQQKLMMQSAAGAGGPSPAAMELPFAVLEVMAARIADLSSAELGARVDPERGLSLTLRVRPRAGTPLAKAAAASQPYAIDAALLEPTGLVMIGAAAPSPFLMELMDAVKTALGKSPASDASATADALGKLTGAMTGAASGVMRLGPAGFAYEYSYALRSEDAGSVAVDAAGALFGSRVFAEMNGKASAPKVTMKREKVAGVSALHTQMTYPVPSKNPAMANAISAMFLSGKLDQYLAASGKRMVAAAGPDAKKRVEALLAGAPRSPSPELAALLADTKSADGVALLDLGKLIPLAMRLDPRSAGMAGALPSTPLPLVATWRGDPTGAVLSSELRLPAATLGAIGTVVQGALGGALMPRGP